MIFNYNTLKKDSSNTKMALSFQQQILERAKKEPDLEKFVPQLVDLITEHLLIYKDKIQ